MVRNQIDFIGIGAPKSGTTWLGTCLAEHPEIGFAADKEVYYFADSFVRARLHAGFNHYARGTEWYHRQFPASKPARIFGEFTVAYMYDPRAAQRIYDYHPGIRLIAVLRDPVEMLHSWYRFNRAGIISDLPATFETAAADTAILDLGRYHRALTPFFERFSENQLKILLYDDIRTDPQGTLRGLFSYLGVDPDFKPSRAEDRVNPATATRYPWLRNAAQTTHALLRQTPLVSAVTSSRSVERMLQAAYGRLNRIPTAYPPIRRETRKALIEYFEEDIHRLEKTLRRDLGAWTRLP